MMCFPSESETVKDICQLCMCCFANSSHQKDDFAQTDPDHKCVYVCVCVWVGGGRCGGGCNIK